MTSGWYFAKAGAAAGSETGPFEWEQLYQLAKNGTVAPDDILWNPKLPRGVEARLVPGLFLDLETSPTPVQQVWVEPTPEPEVTEPQVPSEVERSEPAAEEVAVAEPSADTSPLDDLADLDSDQETTEEPAPPLDKRSQRNKAEKASNRLPLLVVLLVFMIAAAGVASYFLYFRV